MGREVGMCAGADTEVISVFPVNQIMKAGLIWFCPVGYFIVPIAVLSQNLCTIFVHIGCEIRVGLWQLSSFRHGFHGGVGVYSEAVE